VINIKTFLLKKKTQKRLMNLHIKETTFSDGEMGSREQGAGGRGRGQGFT